jgi:hypothetical protein
MLVRRDLDPGERLLEPDAEVERRMDEEAEALPARPELVKLPAPALLPPFALPAAQRGALSTFYTQRQATYALLVQLVALMGWDEFLEVRCGCMGVWVLPSPHLPHTALTRSRTAWTWWCAVAADREIDWRGSAPLLPMAMHAGSEETTEWGLVGSWGGIMNDGLTGARRGGVVWYRSCVRGCF